MLSLLAELDDELLDDVDTLELDSLEYELLLALDELELDDDDCELLDDDDKSSIDNICNRFSAMLAGPGNSKLPVWKFSTSGTLTSPLVRVSVSTACQIVLSGSVWVVFSAPPARFVLIWAAGTLSSPARCIRVIVRFRWVSPTAGPSQKLIDFTSLPSQKENRDAQAVPPPTVNRLCAAALSCRRLDAIILEL